MVRGLSVLVVMGLAAGMAACTSGPSWDQPARTIPTSQPGETNSMSAPPVGKSAVINPDQGFAMDAASGGAYEVQASQLALQKSQTPRVRMIAERMVKDHSDAGMKLDAIVRQKSMLVNDVPSDDQKQMIAKLNDLSGDAFDQEYLSQQKMAHEQTIALFKKEIDSGTDSDLKMFASDTLPTVQAHYQMITGNSGM